MKRALLILVAMSAPVLAQTGEAKRDAARQFRNECSACHFAPDLSFESDQAWLEQIRETA